MGLRLSWILSHQMQGRRAADSASNPRSVGVPPYSEFLQTLQGCLRIHSVTWKSWGNVNVTLGLFLYVPSKKAQLQTSHGLRHAK